MKLETKLKYTQFGRLMHVRDFKKFMAKIPIKTERGEARFEKVKSKLSKLNAGYVATLEGIEFFSGGYMLAISELTNKYKVVEPLLMGRDMTLVYVR